MNSKRLSLGKYCLNEIRSLKFVFKIFFTIIILKSAYHFDPFGISTGSMFYSKTLFYQWTADLHEKKANPVSVVILRDESFKGGWPVKAIVHAEILEEILDQEPKAVFVDFAFIDRRDDETLKNELIPIINEYLKAKIKLYFLSLTPTDRKCNLTILKENIFKSDISSFKNEYASNKECTVFIASSGNTQIIAGYNDHKEWATKYLVKKECVDDNKCEIDNLQLEKLLNKLSARAESLNKIQTLLLHEILL